MELAGLEPATSWVRLGSALAVRVPHLQGFRVASDLSSGARIAADSRGMPWFWALGGRECPENRMQARQRRKLERMALWGSCLQHKRRERRVVPPQGLLLLTSPGCVIGSRQSRNVGQTCVTAASLSDAHSKASPTTSFCRGLSRVTRAASPSFWTTRSRRRAAGQRPGQEADAARWLMPRRGCGRWLWSADRSRRCEMSPSTVEGHDARRPRSAAHCRVRHG